MFENAVTTINVNGGLGYGGPDLWTIDDWQGVTEIENSELRQIANDVLQRAKYSFTSVAANSTQPVRQDSLEEAFKEALEMMDGSKRSRISEEANQLIQAPQSVREVMFGRYGACSAKAFLTDGFERVQEGLPALELDQKLLGMKPKMLYIPQSAMVQATDEGLLVPKEYLAEGYEAFEDEFQVGLADAEESGILNTDRLEEIWGPVYDLETTTNGATAEMEAKPVTDNLAFYITEVKCVDETNPEWLGSDEIALAGVTVDETGDTHKIGERKIGGGFDDGDRRRYSPPWRYTNFNLREGKLWPKAYVVTLIPAEKDQGGLSKVLNTIWQKVDDAVKKAIEKAVRDVLQAKLGPAIAAAIAKAAAWVVDKLVHWIIDAFKDDTFPPAVLSTSIPSYGARWTINGKWGSVRSSLRHAHFYGHGGHYRISYYWQMEA
jgi:hypothetical protein